MLDASLFCWALTRGEPFAHPPYAAEDGGDTGANAAQAAGAGTPAAAEAAAAEPGLAGTGSFATPHRDLPHDQCILPSGRPKIINIWVPLTEATLDNGCMHVLPRESDALWAAAADPAHMCTAVHTQHSVVTGRYLVAHAR